MIQSQTNRDIIRNPLHKQVGIGIDKRINQYFVNLIFAQDFRCTQCHLITDAEETDSYWNQWLRDTYMEPDTDGNLRVNRNASLVRALAATLLIGLASILA
jgi:hypothetical protein